jgi:hypothetical protein
MNSPGHFPSKKRLPSSPSSPSSPNHCKRSHTCEVPTLLMTKSHVNVSILYPLAKSYQCPLCPRLLSKPSGLFVHLASGHRLHKVQAKYKCQVCQKVDRMTGMILHYNQQHRETSSFSPSETSDDESMSLASSTVLMPSIDHLPTPDTPVPNTLETIPKLVPLLDNVGEILSSLSIPPLTEPVPFKLILPQPPTKGYQIMDDAVPPASCQATAPVSDGDVQSTSEPFIPAIIRHFQSVLDQGENDELSMNMTSSPNASPYIEPILSDEDSDSTNDAVVDLDMDTSVDNQAPIPAISSTSSTMLHCQSVTPNHGVVDTGDTVPPTASSPKPSHCLLAMRDHFTVLSSLASSSQSSYLQDTILPSYIQLCGGRLPPSPTQAEPVPATKTVTPPTGDNYSKLASHWQSYFKRAQTKCVRDILEDKGPTCNIPIEQLTSHYKQRLSPPDIDIAKMEQLVNDSISHPMPSSAFNISPISPFEIITILKSSNHSAPGQDRLLYSDLLKSDPTGEALSLIYNACLNLSIFPAQWKQSSVTLIHKKGNVNDEENWRPIAISSTMGRLLSKLLAKRLMSFLDTNQLLSSTQKGFLQCDGVNEHISTLHAMLSEAKKGSSFAFIDFRDAFTSVPHELLWTSLKRFHVPPQIIALIRNSYEGATVLVKNATHQSAPIPMQRGVRQGDPLSPLLFNCAIETLLQVIAQQKSPYLLFGKPISHLAYADDVMMSFQYPRALQQALHSLHSTASTLGLAINSKKCATLVVNQTEECFDLNNGDRLPRLEKKEAYSYLGRNLGQQVNGNANTLVETIQSDLKRVADSYLSPQQKLLTATQYILPKYSFSLRTDSSTSNSSIIKLKYTVSNWVKGILRIPQSGSLHYLSAPRHRGGLGILLPGEELDIATISQSLKLLSSSDSTINHFANHQLRQEVIKRTGLMKNTDPSLDQINSFLNGHGPLKHSTGLQNIWFRVRRAIHRLKQQLPINLSLKLGTDGVPCVEASTNQSSLFISASSTESPFTSLRRFIHESHYLALLSLQHQGSAFSSIVQDPASYKFIGDGKFISNPSYLWCHRARLGLLELNGSPRHRHAKRKGIIGPLEKEDSVGLCRQCGKHLESQSHVLCHCEKHLATSITHRHNCIVKLISRSFISALPRISHNPDSSWNVYHDCPINIIEGSRRPDIWAINTMERKAVLVDVTCPYEHDASSLSTSYQRKTSKYKLEQQKLEAMGFHVQLGAVVVGALGSWSTLNSVFLRECGLTSQEVYRLSRSCVALTIDHSRGIFFSHVMGSRYNAAQESNSSHSSGLAYTIPSLAKVKQLTMQQKTPTSKPTPIPLFSQEELDLLAQTRPKRRTVRHSPSSFHSNLADQASSSRHVPVPHHPAVQTTSTIIHGNTINTTNTVVERYPSEKPVVQPNFTWITLNQGKIFIPSNIWKQVNK